LNGEFSRADEGGSVGRTFSLPLDPEVFVSVDENERWTSMREVSKDLVRDVGCVILDLKMELKVGSEHRLMCEGPIFY
jgi:hypothetical protein